MPTPTCVMSFGDDAGAIGYLVGEEQGGMRAMFTMMNNARLQVGLRGPRDRRTGVSGRLWPTRGSGFQGRAPPRPGTRSVPGGRIVEHPDVRRMLMTMKTQIEAMRALAYTARRGAGSWPSGETDAAAARRRRGSPRPADAAGQGLVHRSRLFEISPRPRCRCTGGMGYIRGDGHRPDAARCAHRDDLRGHQRHSGARPGRA